MSQLLWFRHSKLSLCVLTLLLVGQVSAFAGVVAQSGVDVGDRCVQRVGLSDDNLQRFSDCVTGGCKALHGPDDPDPDGYKKCRDKAYAERQRLIWISQNI